MLQHSFQGIGDAVKMTIPGLKIDLQHGLRQGIQYSRLSFPHL